MSDLRQKVEAKVDRLVRERVARLRHDLDQALQALNAPLDLSLDQGTWGAEGDAAQLRALRDALEAIAAHERSQRDILSALLGAASACYPRVALFVVKGRTLVGWAGRGFTGTSGPVDETLSQVSLPATGDHLLARAVQSRSLVLAGSEGPGRVVSEVLGGIAPQEAAAMPLLLRGRPVALLYGDSGHGGGASQELLFEVVARLGGLAMESLATESPRRARPGDARESAPDDAGAPGAGALAATPPEDAEMRALLQDLDGHPRRVTADGGVLPDGPDEARERVDAQRFASLLVSELLLYNEEAVILGRKHGDLYRRLQKEIDRSRRAYAARVPPDLAGASNFLEEELVRVLADGDRALLGA